MKKILHQLLIGIFCLILAWTSLASFRNGYDLFESSDAEAVAVLEPGMKVEVLRAGAAQEEILTGSSPLFPGDLLLTGDTAGVRVTIPGAGEMRLSSNTKLRLSVVPSDSTPGVLTLEEGQVWTTTIGSRGTLRLVVPGGVVAFIEDASLDLSYRDRVATFFAAKHPTRVGLFLPQKDAASAPESNVTLLNSVLVTERNTLVVPVSKIQPKLEKLLYSKLVKEFQYAPMNETLMKENVWIQKNYSQDDDRRDALITQVVHTVKARGLAVSDPDSFFTSVLQQARGVRSLLTFQSDMKRRYEVNDLMADMDDAMYFYNTSQSEAAGQRVEYFFGKLAEKTENEQFLAEVHDALWNRFETFSIAIPQDGALFTVRSSLRQSLLRLNTLGYKLSFDHASQLARSYLLDIYQSLGFDDAITQDLLASYFSTFKNLFTTYAGDISKNPIILAEENQLLTQLYLRDPIFYRGSSFQNKFALEAEWLKLLPEGRDKNEEQQTLVASKVDLMKRLRYFFFAEKIPVADASSVLFRLLSDISSAIYQTDTAVAQYFQDSIDAQEDFLQYLNSSDFSDSKLYGPAHKERFLAFLKNKKDLKEIDKIQEGLLGTISSESKEVKETLSELQKKFAAVGVQKLKIAPLLDKDQVQVFIESAEYNSIPFSGIYDRDRSYISDVKVYNETILSAAVPLDKLKSIFKVQSQDPMFAAPDTDEATVEDRVEKVAKLFLLRKLKEVGFVLDLEMIQTEDYAMKTFRIEHAKLPFQKSEIDVSFEFDLVKNQVSGVKVVVLDKELPMTGSYPLGNVAGKIQSFYDQEFYKLVEVKQ